MFYYSVHIDAWVDFYWVPVWAVGFGHQMMQNSVEKPFMLILAKLFCSDIQYLAGYVLYFII